MDYREALHIGSKAEGVIKCTFARLYDRPVSKEEQNFRYLFSLQRRDAGKLVYYPNGDMSVAPQLVTDKNRDGVWFKNANEDGYIAIDLPIVTVSEIADGVVVPAQFTPEAIEILRDAMSKVKSRMWIIYRVWDVDTPGKAKGEREAMAKTYAWSESWEYAWIKKDTDNYHHEVWTTEVTNPRFERMIEIIESGEPIYIKPAAFEWYPLDINNATIVEKGEDGEEYELNLDDAIAAAEERLNKAKAILIAAGFTNII